MSKVPTSVPWFRGGIALLLALLVVAATLPDTGKIVMDNTTSPPTLHIEGRFIHSVIIIAIALLPVACIFCLGRRWLAAEVIGWMVLSYLVIATFMR